MAGMVLPYMIVDRASDIECGFLLVEKSCNVVLNPYNAGTEPYKSRQECGDLRFQSEGNCTLGDGHSTTSRDDFPTRTVLEHGSA